MKKKTLSNEIMTGIMVLVCIGLLLFFLFKTGKIGARPQAYHIKAVFNTAGGTENNAPVMLAGVEVGEVKAIKLTYDPETQVVFTLSIDKRAKVRADSVASINTLGLMGEKYIEISSGSSGAPFVEPGSVIRGEDPFQFEKLAKKGEEVAETLDQTLVDIRKLVNNVDDMVVDNRKGIDSIIADLEATARNFKEFSEDIKHHPWKLLMKGKEKKKTTDEDDDKRDRSRRRRRR
jgi:phospholipid/cholesterol/gamma-HCH transport system substrate-binding protein